MFSNSIFAFQMLLHASKVVKLLDTYLVMLPLIEFYLMTHTWICTEIIYASRISFGFRIPIRALSSGLTSCGLLFGPKNIYWAPGCIFTDPMI